MEPAIENEFISTPRMLSNLSPKNKNNTSITDENIVILNGFNGIPLFLKDSIIGIEPTMSITTKSNIVIARILYSIILIFFKYNQKIKIKILILKNMDKEYRLPPVRVISNLPPIEDYSSYCFECEAGMCDICKKDQYKYGIDNYIEYE